MFRLFAALILATIGVSQSEAGELRAGTSDFCDWEFSGEIVEGDAAKIEAIPGSYSGHRLCLDSPGGSLSEGLKIFDLIWDANIKTVVLPGKRCNSACSLAFLGGSVLEGTDVTRQMDRLIWIGSQLGFHGPSLNLKTGQTFGDSDLNRAFQIAIAAAARLFEVNRVQDRGDRAMTDHLYHRWLNTDPSNMYFIDTVGDAILSDISVAGIEFGIELDTTSFLNICNNVVLKGSYPSGYGLSGTIHQDFRDTKALLAEQELENKNFDMKVLTWRDGDYLRAFVGLYYSATKYYLNGCVVTLDTNSIAAFQAEDYYLQTTPIDVDIVAISDEIPSRASEMAVWVKGQRVLQSRQLTPIYLFPFDKKLTDLPTSTEFALAANPSPRTESEWESPVRMLEFYNRDLPGGDIATMANDGNCHSICTNSDQCVAVTIDDWNQICFLKGHGALPGILRIQPKATTYIKPEFASIVAQDTTPPVMKYRKGKGFDQPADKVLSVQNYDVCAAQCLADKECVVINYRVSNLMCEMFTYAVEYETMSGVELGIKLQVE